MTATDTTLSFQDAYELYGWTKVTAETDKLGFSPNGGCTIRKDHVRIEVCNGALGCFKGVVHFYDSSKASIVISAIVVDFGHRGIGLGHAALRDIIEMADLLKWDELWLEAAKIARRGIGHSAMNDESLRYWYKRHGFVLQAESSNRVLVRKRQ